MTTATSVFLTDDHIDLLVTAAWRWRLLPFPHATAASDHRATCPLVGTATEVGRLLRGENTAAAQWLSDRGRTRLSQRVTTKPYTYLEVEHLDPVEVLKAVHAAQSCCAASPTWDASATGRLLAAIATAATHRVDGYRDAPWSWTRPQRRAGRPVGVAGTWRPTVPGLAWVAPDELRETWSQASLVVITTEVAATIPVDLPARPGVFVLAKDEHPNEVWQALTALDLQAMVLFWPTCRPWLLSQLRDPAREFVEHREGRR